MRAGEKLFLTVVVVLAGAGVAVDRFAEGRPPPVPQEAAGRFLSSGWFCPAPSGEGIDTVVATTNLGDEGVHLRRYGIGGGTKGNFLDAEVPGLHRNAISVAEFGISGAAGVVEAFGAATTTDVVTVSGAGVASSRCLVQPSGRWYFASGSTLRGRDSYLLVANPFDEEGVIRVRLLLPAEDVVPARLTDLVIPKLGQTEVFLGDFFPETESFGIDLTATRGRLALSRFDRVDSRDGWRGLALNPGIREPSPRWFFAGGEVPVEGEQFLMLTNPGESEALVRVIVQTETEQLAPPTLAELPVPAARQLTIRMADHIPRGIRHGTLVNSINEVPVIAERQTFGSLEGGRGLDATVGVPAISPRWVLPVGSPAGGREAIAVVNFSQQRAVFGVVLITSEGLVSPPELSEIAVEASRRATIDITPFVPQGGATALIEARSGEIAVERHLWLGDPYRDFSDSPGQPL